MKKILATGIAVIGLASAGSAFAQATSSTSATGSVTILRPLTVTKNTGGDLEFGRIVKPTTGSGTVSMSNTSDSVTAGSGAVALSGITTSRAKFTIDGEGAQLVNITVPASFNITNGTDTISVTTTNNLGTSTTLSGSLGGAGSAALNVGGSFSVPSANSTGLYTGTLNVSVAYN